jgi:hypothetical protein
LFTVAEWLAQARVNPSMRENMKRLLLVALLAIVTVSGARAQENSATASQANANIAADFASTSTAPTVPDVSVWAPTESRPNPAEPSPAAPAPAPKFAYGSRDDYRWQLGLGISLVRFRSSLFYATGVGTHSSLAYFTNDWFALEGAVTTAIAPAIYRTDHVKFFSYGAGPKIAWRARKLEPWAHLIGGGMHILPQTAGHSQNGLAFDIGGGVDYRFFPHLSLRTEVDWIKTRVFGEWGNSAQANVDIVLHF